MSTLTIEEQRKIADWLEEHPVLSVGVGSEESACSIAAINLALSGRLTDEIPECMSEVIGAWIIRVQDKMPDEIRNSAEWRVLLPRAAGTGRDLERERLNIILDWMWETVLPSMQPMADASGFGAAWRDMLEQRSAEATRWAAEAATAAVNAPTTRWAMRAAVRDAARTADAARWAMRAAATAARAAYVTKATMRAADWAARTARWAAGGDAAWHTFDPVGLLQRLIEVEA